MDSYSLQTCIQIATAACIAGIALGYTLAYGLYSTRLNRSESTLERFRSDLLEWQERYRQLVNRRDAISNLSAGQTPDPAPRPQTKRRRKKKGDEEAPVVRSSRMTLLMGDPTEDTK